MSNLGYGRAYRYAHDEPHGYAAGESYLPPGLNDLDIRDWYEPTDRGLESRIQEKLDRLRQLDQEYERSQRK
jgi:putative ATPase